MYSIDVGNGEYKVHHNNLSIRKDLDPAVYRIDFDDNKGFFLKMMPDFVIKEKIYGDINEKIALVMESYENSNRSLGVLISGKKGFGKTLAATRLCQSMQAKGLPILIVDHAIRGIGGFIQSIDCETVVMFDEFDKNFYDDNYTRVNSKDSVANELLGLFDGIDQTKRLFLATVNKISDISEYMINRPGRFHYHFKFDYPDIETIETYLNDKVNQKYTSVIPEVLKFAKKNRFNFDALRAIVFEVNQGHDFNKVIKYLNVYELFGFAKITVIATVKENDEVFTGLTSYNHSYIKNNILVPLTSSGNRESLANDGNLVINLEDFEPNDDGDLELKPGKKLTIVVFNRRKYKTDKLNVKNVIIRYDET